MQDKAGALTGVTIALHWLVAIGMMGLIGLGIYMEQNEAYALYGLHKSLGMLILLLVLPRVIWRVIKGWPTPVNTVKKIEQLLAKVGHWVLIVGTVLFPVSGMLMSGAGGRGLYIFGWELLGQNRDAVTDKIVPLNESLAGLGHQVHGILVWVMCITIALHIAGALKHHLVYKDHTLRRMLGK